MTRTADICTDAPARPQTGRDGATPAKPAAGAPQVTLPEAASICAAALGIDLRGALEEFGSCVDLYQEVLGAAARAALHLPQDLQDSLAAGDVERARMRIRGLRKLALALGWRRMAELATSAETTIGTPQGQLACASLNQALQQEQTTLFALLGALRPLARQRPRTGNRA
jgi:HPt (histidine-containing phosphotransfer) domain-containing protein